MPVQIDFGAHYTSPSSSYVVGGFCCCSCPMLVSRLHDADLGYVLIVDRRSDRWNAVKATLLRLSVCCGAIVKPTPRHLSHFLFFVFHFTSTRHSFIHVSLTFVPFFPYVWKLPKHSIVSENSLTPFFYSSLHELQFERFHFKPLVWGLMIILTFLLLSLFAEFLSWPDCCRVRSAAVWPSPESHLRSQQ